jgi:hypothetical protein
MGVNGKPPPKGNRPPHPQGSGMTSPPAPPYRGERPRERKKKQDSGDGWLWAGVAGYLLGSSECSGE